MFSRNVFCKQKVIEYIDKVQEIVQEGVDNGDIVNCNAEMLAAELFSLTCAALIYKRKAELEQISVQDMYKEYEKTFFNKLVSRGE